MAPRCSDRKPDAELVREALTGTKEPLAELVTRHWETAVFLAARVLGSLELARDAAQEATVAAMTDLGRLRAPDRFGAWFCGIAVNVARRWHRQLGPESLGLPAERPSGVPGPDEVAELADAAARVRAAVAALPGGQRDAVLLFYLHGLSHREVAAELRISVGAVKSRLHQARAGLARMLAHMAETPAATAETTEGRTMPASDALEWRDVAVAEIRRAGDPGAPGRKHVMVLAERGGDGRLPIWVGEAEATALAMALESVEVPRPFTYKLAASLIGAAGARVSEVRITRLIDSVFYAEVIVQGPHGPREVDARPSDAVNLALVAGAPIRVDQRLFGAGGRYDDEARECPVATAELAAEARQRMADLARELAARQEAGPAS